MEKKKVPKYQKKKKKKEKKSISFYFEKPCLPWQSPKIEF